MATKAVDIVSQGAIGARDLARIAAQASPVSALAVSVDTPRLSLPDVRSGRVDLKLPKASAIVSASLPQPIPPDHATPEVDTRSATESRPAGGEIASPADLGRLVREARERRNLSQQSFADLAGVGRRFVSELENGKATLEFGKVIKVARAAGLSLYAEARRGG